MNLLVSLLGCVADYVFTVRRRISCIHDGHNLLCTVDGHLCVRCGRQWCHY